MLSVSRLITYFQPNSYELSLDIDRPKRTFSGVVIINGVAKNEHELRLHAKDLKIESIHVNQTPVSWQLDTNDELTFAYDSVLDSKCTITVVFSGTITDQMHGMYPCFFDHDGTKKELIATQFESHHAREAFPCIDEPEAKATFDVTLTTEQNVEVLGNMPVKSSKQEVVSGKELLVTTFERTPRMSSYLLAWVIGDLHKRSAKTKRGVEVNVWATRTQKLESLDFALDFATRCIDFYEEYFGVDYPLPKSDHVALPDFTSGAMENWGLITYREIALLADPDTATIDSKHYVAMVVAHELSHQWFGNLVTMKWWDNLWLNESFANFIENLPIHAMHPEWNIWMDYASTWSLMALRRDAIDGVQPVQTEVRHPDEITSLFDGAIVYGKGGRLIGMLREYVGEADFRAGLKRYFETFAYQNTTGSDLWDALEAVSGKPVGAFMNKWILRSGYPVVHVRTDGLSQEQFFIGSHEASDKIWPIPLAAQPAGTIPAVLETQTVSTQIALDTRLNVGNWSHFITDYSKQHFAHLLGEISSYSPLDRLQLINERILLTRSGHVPNDALIPLLQASTHETDEGVWGILHLGLSELKKFVEFDEPARSGLKKLARQIADVQYDRLGWNAGKNEPENDTKLRPIILALKLYGEDQAAIETAVKQYHGAAKIDELNPELRSIILAGKVKAGVDRSEFDALLQDYTSSNSSLVQEDIIGALTGSDNVAQIEHLLACLLDKTIIRPQDASHVFAYLVRNRIAKEAAWQWLRQHWDWVEATYGGDKSFDDFVRFSASALTTHEQLHEFREFFTPIGEREPSIHRAIKLGDKEIAARIELIERDGDAVRNILRSNDD